MIACHEIVCFIYVVGVLQHLCSARHLREVNPTSETTSLALLDERMGDLDELYDYHLEIIDGSTDTYSSDEMIITDEEHFSNSTNTLSAIDREREERSNKFLDKPHIYPVGITVMSQRYMEELKAEGKPSKTQNKVKNATKRFLEYREIHDLELRLITPKIVSDYIKFGRTENRAISTFRNDINYLGAVFEFAKKTRVRADLRSGDWRVWGGDKR